MYETPEWLIADLEAKVAKLEEDVLEAQKNAEMLNSLAFAWKKAHDDLKTNSRKAIGNLEAVVSELESEIKGLKSNLED